MKKKDREIVPHTTGKKLLVIPPKEPIKDIVDDPKHVAKPTESAAQKKDVPLFYERKIRGRKHDLL